ncbi:histidine kinase [Patiriisocius marinistellae]|uniref:Histidine kinase n=1 Tax=Patiriisocius marinistellae TaxID=2494560 RepID=A0A5J4G0P7_9FLAO|nr:2TM domain-containing protein [Patiriisocius marinistellae]GEQ85905.1 histidine kinase [Patiriisocius marinistellae]
MKNLSKEIGKATFIGLLVFLVISLIQYANGFNVVTSGRLMVNLLLNMLYSYVLYFANTLFFNYFLSEYKGKLFKVKNLTLGIFGGIIVTLVCIVLLRFFTEVVYAGQSLEYFIANERIAYYYVSFLISAVVTSLFYVVFYYKHKQEGKVKESQIIAGTASAKFDALKNQLDPHFLFNSLNVLTSLIEENPRAATKFTTSLSKVYRYVLEQKNKDLVTITEELKFAQLYMSLLKMRFEDSIVFTIPSEISDPEAKVVPLALQLLLENAVKHNQVMPNKKLHITITENNGNLIIENNIQPKQTMKESSGVGLKNIKQRYQLLTTQPVRIVETKETFSISIPMLERTTTVMRTQTEHISEKKYELAKERVEKLKGFYVHFAIYLTFVPIFIWLWYQSNTSFPWFLFPIGGWGFGVLGHASDTFDWNPFFSKDWEQRKIKELMDEDDNI